MITTEILCRTATPPGHSADHPKAPPEHAGQTVLIARQERKIVIRSSDMIIAEHPIAQKAGSTVADPAHLAALWKLAVQQTKLPPPRWQLTFDQQVETAPLARYQEAAG